MKRKTTGLYPSDRSFERSGAKPPRTGVLIGGSVARAKQHEYAVLFVLHVFGGLGAVWWLLTHSSSWVEWSCFIVGYLLVNLGISVGAHRYFTHRAFECSTPMRYFLGIMAQCAAQGSVRKWAADHRRHHAFADEPGDIHSPHIDGHGRKMGLIKGLGIAHFGWLFDNSHSDMRFYSKGLAGDPAAEFCHRTRWLWVVVSFVIFPALWGLAFGGPEAVIGTVLVGGFLRNFIFLNGVMGVNSFAHRFGYKRFQMRHEARNNWWLNLLVLGDAWHNNHHAHPRSAMAGITWWELDFNGWTILAFEKLGLVWNVQRAPKYRRDGTLVERQDDGELVPAE